MGVIVNRNATSVLLCTILALLLFLASITPANALDVKPEIGRGDVSAQPEIWFDIAPQPLASALEAYGRRVGVQILYKSTLVEGVRSPGVLGGYSRIEGLMRLLDGTSLSAQYIDANSLTLARIDPRLTDGGASPSTPAAAAIALTPIRVESPAYDTFLYDNYAELVRSRIRRRLSIDSKINVAARGLRIMVWVNGIGVIQRAAVFQSSGNENTDDTVVKSVDGLAVSAHPPGGFPQPLHVWISN